MSYTIIKMNMENNNNTHDVSLHSLYCVCWPMECIKHVIKVFQSFIYKTSCKIIDYYNYTHQSTQTSSVYTQTL